MSEQDDGAGGLMRIPLADIRLSDTAAQRTRREGSDSAEIKGLAASIEAVGLLSPLVVRRRPAKHRDEIATLEPPWQLVAGERRLEALRRLGRETAPCVTAGAADLDDATALTAQLVENLQREGLDPLAEARGYSDLVRSGLTTTQIAERVGRGETTVRARLSLVELAPEAAAALRAGDILLGVAELLARWPADLQPALLRAALPLEWRDGDGPRTTSSVAADFARGGAVELAKAPFALADHPPHEKERHGSCDGCPARGRGPGALGSGMCLDPACYRALAMAVAREKIRAAEDRGEPTIARVIDCRSSTYVGPRDHLSVGSKWGTPRQVVRPEKLAELPRYWAIVATEPPHQMPAVNRVWRRKDLEALNSAARARMTAREKRQTKAQKRRLDECVLWIDVARRMGADRRADPEDLLEIAIKGVGVQNANLMQGLRGEISAERLLAAIPLLPAYEWEDDESIEARTARLREAAAELGLKARK